LSNLKDIVFDCTHAWAQANWWAETLGYRVRPHSEEDLAALRADGVTRKEDDPNVALDPVDEAGPSVWFCRVPERKTVKNRGHIDVFGDANALIARGATLVEEHRRWIVLADPEGNEFCVFAREATQQ
jgi:glyoxalase superfamily protein